MRTGRLGSLARWTCTALCLATTIAWCVSIRWTLFAMLPFGDAAGLKAGTAFCAWTSPALRQQLVAAARVPPRPRWRYHLARRQTPMEWFPPLHTAGGGRTLVALPLWAPWLAAASASALLWARRRGRTRPGHCPDCNYNLTGLAADAPCPECGSR